tara:strand:- start:27 stop:599 length:573 start_codon:yes stop_codon:yes gene_type:complete
MRITKSQLKKIIKEEIKIVLTEGETEVETVNKSVAAGDWIIRAMTRAGEQYVVKQAKFPKLYAPDPALEGFQVYNVIPDPRTAIVITPELAAKLKGIYPEGKASQADFHEKMLEVPTIEVNKQSQVFAKEAKGGETIETKVEKAGGDIILQFEAPWGGTMPIKLDDVLIINNEEVYRIAKAEFDQTYRSV